MPTPDEITRRHDDDPPPGESPWVDPDADRRLEIRVVEPDPAWPAQYAELERRVRSVLGDRVLELHHVGSTAVPGLPAKPVIDADLVVADPADEAAYVPELVAAGFVHVVREPWWHEHRMLRWEQEPRAHLHVFGPDCPEVVRNLMFRDWLREHADDRERYTAAKRAAASQTNARPGGGTGMDYNSVKAPVVHEIYDRIFRAHGLL